MTKDDIAWINNFFLKSKFKLWKAKKSLEKDIKLWKKENESKKHPL